MRGLHCYGMHYGHYDTVKEAVSACSADPNCGAVYDHQCDSSAHDIYLCPKDLLYRYQQEESEEGTDESDCDLEEEEGARSEAEYEASRPEAR